MFRLRFLPLVAMLLLLTTPARADGIDVKVKGEWDFAFGWNIHSGLRKHVKHDDNFIANQRVRTQINFITSEYLQGVLMFEIGDLEWGNKGTGAALDTDGVNVETKRAYLDWIIPNTEISVRMGLQGIGLPMGNDWTNPVFNNDAAGIVIAYEPFEWLATSLFWARPFDRGYSGHSDAFDRSISDEMDMFGLVLAFSGEGWSFSPWGAYARIGNASGFMDYVLGDSYEDFFGTEDFSIGSDDGNHTNAWWLGFSTEVSILEPLSFSLDAMYGKMNATDYGLYGDWGFGWEEGPRQRIGTEGWFVAAALNYELDWAVPGIFGWYASGDDYDDVIDKGEYGRMPALGFDDGFAPTTFGFPGTFAIGSDTAIATTGMGTWGIGVQLADISFIEDLSHTIRFAYYRGTNDDKIIRDAGWALPFSGESEYLTDKDYVLEVNFDHTYQIYENLLMVVELSWLRLHLDDDTWKNYRGDNNYTDTENAWKAQVNFQYSF